MVSLIEIVHSEEVGVDGRIVLNYILNVGRKGSTGFVKQMIPSVIHYLRNPVDLDYLAQGGKRYGVRLDTVMGRCLP